MMWKRATISDIARAAKVSVSTVSGVVNSRPHSGRTGQKTRERILKLAKELNYAPNNAARTLSTGKTYHIGYLVSSKATLGLANSYFATILAGIQDVCQHRGYNCTVSAYDLSSLKDFVMPPKLQRRCVDGVVITGAVQAEVIELFLDRNIPFVLSGDNTDFPLQGILAVASDMAENWQRILGYLAGLGHLRIAVACLVTEHAIKYIQEGLSRLGQKGKNIKLTFMAAKNGEAGSKQRAADEFQMGADTGHEWLEMDKTKRPTAMVGSDQWCVGFLSSVLRGGARCPGDVSIVSMNDTSLTQWYTPAITALPLDLFRNGQMAAEILIGLLEKTMTRTEAFRQAQQYRVAQDIIVRESTGPVP